MANKRTARHNKPREPGSLDEFIADGYTLKRAIASCVVIPEGTPDDHFCCFACGKAHPLTEVGSYSGFMKKNKTCKACIIKGMKKAGRPASRKKEILDRNAKNYLAGKLQPWMKG